MATAPLSSPAELFGELLHEVQMRRLFPDGKRFVDMEPRRHPTEIMARYHQLHAQDDHTLAEFVAEYFNPPTDVSPGIPDGARTVPLLEHISATWEQLARSPGTVSRFSSALPLNASYVAPGGRFREFYYWDSYFTMLGLRADRRDDLVEATIANCTTLIERFGYVPNGSRTYYLGRSQPPVYYLMLDLSQAASEDIKRLRLEALLTEHAFWMEDATRLRPGEASRHAVCMPDGRVLNRYWDACERPRDESYSEDMITAQRSERQPSDVFRNLRAAAESGWDFSSRWYGDENDLGSTRTSSIAPVDLNCLLFGLEQSIVRRARDLGQPQIATQFEVYAERRRCTVQAYCWSELEQRFGDCLWQTGQMTPSINAAALFPMFTGVAVARQAIAMARLVQRDLLAPGGLRTTTIRSGEQWDSPNGWAPLQWIGAMGLIRYGHEALGRTIAERWISTVARDYEDLALIFEKYDVESRVPGRGGEYPVQTGFGWTNGVVRALLDSFEIEPNLLASAGADSTSPCS